MITGPEIVSVTLNEEDVAKLLANPDADARAEVAGKIASQHQSLSDGERKMAEDIFRLMVKDAEVRVRQALSAQLKQNAMLPHDVAMALARDVEEVSLPFLEFSSVLTDDDLIEIVKSQESSKAQAVARRPHVSAKVSDALVETHNEDVVAALVANKGAEISEATMHKVVEEFGSNDKVGKPLSERDDLPVNIIEELMSRVSDSIRNYLISQQKLTPQQVDALLVQTREMAVLGLSSSHTDPGRLVDHLFRNGRLTPSIILRAVCLGDLSFFENALARLAKVKVENARTLIYDEGKLGFMALYEKSGLPKSMYRAVRAAVDVVGEMQYDGAPHDRERFSRRMIERILTQYGDLGVQFEGGDLEYLLSKVNQLPTTFVTQ